MLCTYFVHAWGKRFDGFFLGGGGGGEREREREPYIHKTLDVRPLKTKEVSYRQGYWE